MKRWARVLLVVVVLALGATAAPVDTPVAGAYVECLTPPGAVGCVAVAALGATTGADGGILILAGYAAWKVIGGTFTTNTLTVTRPYKDWCNSLGACPYPKALNPWVYNNDGSQTTMAWEYPFTVHVDLTTLAVTTDAIDPMWSGFDADRQAYGLTTEEATMAGNLAGAYTRVRYDANSLGGAYKVFPSTGAATSHWSPMPLRTFPTTGWTVEEWVNLPSSGVGGNDQVLMSCDGCDDVDTGFWEISALRSYHTTNKFAVSLGVKKNGGTDTSTQPTIVNEPTYDQVAHVAMTYNGDGTVDLYFDGAPVEHYTLPADVVNQFALGTLSEACNCTHLGEMNGGAYVFSGRLRLFAQYTQPLTATQIQDHYNGSPVATTDPHLPPPTPSTIVPQAPPAVPTPVTAPAPTTSPTDPDFGWLGDVITGGLSALSDTIVSAVQTIVDTLVSMLQAVIDTIVAWLNWVGSVVIWMGTLTVDLLTVAVQLLNGILGALGSLLGQLIATVIWMVQLVVNLLTDALAILGDVLTAVQELVTTVATTIATSLADLLDAVLALPQALVDLLTATLVDLFVPSPEFLSGLVDDLQTAVSTHFPFGYASAGITAVGTFQSDVAGSLTAHSCSPHAHIPTWDKELYLPTPSDSGCPGNGPGGTRVDGDNDAGDVFGYRTVVRNFLLLLMMVGVAMRVTGFAPWAKQDSGGPEQLTLFED